MKNSVATALLLIGVVVCIVLTSPIFDPPADQHQGGAPPEDPRRMPWAGNRGVPEPSDGQRALEEGRVDDAIAYYEQRLREDSADPRARFMLAWSVHESGDMERAVKLHREASMLESYRAVSLYNLGCALARLGRGDEAIAALEDAIEAGFGDWPHAARDPDLEALRDDPRLEALLVGIGMPPIDRGPLAYWLGHWVARGAEDEPIGRCNVERTEGDYLIVEHWSDRDGRTGRSLTYRDPADDRWKQDAFDSDGAILHLAGTLGDDDRLVLTGERIAADGRVERVRRIVEPGDEGGVRSLLRRSFDDGETWETLAETTYTSFNPDRFVRPIFTGPRRGGGPFLEDINQD